jgi:hypothetical protein
MGPFRDSDDWQEPTKLQDWVPAAYARRSFWWGYIFGGTVVITIFIGRAVLQWWFA